VLQHWARGIAMAKLNEIEGAKNELKLMLENINKPDMLVVLQPFNAPIDAAKVAQKLLEGTIAEQENNLPNAIKLFTEAVKAEDAMIYNEPQDWLLPARQYLGAALLKSGSYSNAATIFKEDLKENPNNHWSLKGLYESLQKQQQSSEAALIKKQLDKTVATNNMKNLPVVY